MEKSMIKVGIVGGTGYTGVELLRLLAQHPKVQLHSITSRTEAGTPVAEMFSSLRGRVHLQFTTPDKANLHECDTVFFATPHGVAMAQAKELLAANVKILDLAADFRLQDTAVFEKWYGMPHACPEILKEAVYGLPEVNREAIKKARLVGLAGCYPTSVQLGFAPLLSSKNGLNHPLVESQNLIADCKSGTSGAGRKAEIPTLLSEASDNFKAYGVKGHRHLPEIMTLYARILPEGRSIDFQALYEQFYANEPFIDVLPPGSHPETRSVRGSNGMKIAIHRPGGGDTLVILVVEDNLVKGASGQGVQCMNLMFGFPENMGLEQIALLP